MPGSYGFTGQHSDASTTGLDYYGARYYDPTLGQFTSADTTLAGGLNRYAYVGGNPATYTDPSGHWRTDCDSCGVGQEGNWGAPSGGAGGSWGGASGWTGPSLDLATLTAFTLTAFVIIAAKEIGHLIASLPHATPPIAIPPRQTGTGVTLTHGATIGSGTVTGVHTGPTTATGGWTPDPNDPTGTKGNGNGSNGGQGKGGTGTSGTQLYRGSDTSGPPQGSDIRAPGYQGTNTRPGIDIRPDGNGQVGPGITRPQDGLSTFDGLNPKLSANTWWTVSSDDLPDGLGIYQGGTRVVDGVAYTHYSIVPTTIMSFPEYISLLDQIPWLPVP